MFKDLYDYFRMLFSGSFDSKYYLSTYPDVLQSDTNPLWHFIRFGRKEGRSPSKQANALRLTTIPDQEILSENTAKYLQNPINTKVNHQSHIKLIEFIGIPGSGKTTLYKHINSFLLTKLGYSPGPTNLFEDMLNDHRYKLHGGNNYIYLKSFLINNATFIKNLLISDEKLSYPDNLRTIRKISLSYIFTLCTFYQAINTNAPNDWLMFDEGFCYYLANYIIDGEGIIKEELAEELFSAMPKPDLLIFVKSDPCTCLKRMKTREQGIPTPYQKLSDTEMLEILSKLQNNLDHFYSFMQSKNMNVIEIDSQQPISKSIDEIESSIMETLF